MEIPTYPDEEIKAEDLSWRQRQRVKKCGDKLLVLCICHDGEVGWLYLEDPEQIVDYMIEGEPGDEWRMKWVLMSRAEVEALPEHPGW